MRLTLLLLTLFPLTSFTRAKTPPSNLVDDDYFATIYDTRKTMRGDEKIDQIKKIAELDFACGSLQIKPFGLAMAE